MSYLLVFICLFVLAAVVLTLWMFRRKDEFAGLVGLFMITIAGFLAVVYGGMDS